MMFPMFLFVFGFILLLTPSLPSAAEWSQFRSEATHSGRQNLLTCATTLSSSPTLKWNFTTSNFVWSSPTIGSDGTVFVGSDGSKVYALNGTTGALIWNYPTGSAVRSSPAIGSDGTVFVGSEDSKVYALNGTTGALIWNYYRW